MNKQRRQAIWNAINQIEAVKKVVEQIYDEEQDAFNNMPESLQASANGEASEEAQAHLEEAIDSLEDAIACLEEVQ